MTSPSVPAAPPTASAPSRLSRAAVGGTFLLLLLITVISWRVGWRAAPGTATLEPSAPDLLVLAPDDGYFMAEPYPRGAVLKGATLLGRIHSDRTVEQLAAAERMERELSVALLAAAESAAATVDPALRVEAERRMAERAVERARVAAERERLHALADRAVLRVPADGVLMDAMTGRVVRAGEVIARLYAGGPVPVTLRLPMARRPALQGGGFRVDLSSLAPGAGSLIGWIDAGSARPFEARRDRHGAIDWCEVSGWLPGLPRDLAPLGQMLPLLTPAPPPEAMTRAEAPAALTALAGVTSRLVRTGLVVPLWRASLRSAVDGVVVAVPGRSDTPVDAGQPVAILERLAVSNALDRAQSTGAAAARRVQALDAELAAARIRSLAATALAAAGGLATNEASVAMLQTDRIVALQEASREDVARAAVDRRDAEVVARRHVLAAGQVAHCAEVLVQTGAVLRAGDAAAELRSRELVLRILVDDPRPAAARFETAAGHRLAPAAHLPVRPVAPGCWSMAFTLPAAGDHQSGELFDVVASP